MMGPEEYPAGEEEAALDALLASWAQRHALSPECLEAVHQETVGSMRMAADMGLAEAILPLAWWERFFADLQSSLQRAASIELVLSVAGHAA